MWGGFQGQGVKTITVARASAKLVARLVPDQDPDAVFEVRHPVITIVQEITIAGKLPSG